jgi:NAD kinase
MWRLTENKIVLITRPTRLDELVARFNTVAQARFYVEHLGADFSDYQHEDECYRQALAQTRTVLDQLGRVQWVERRFLPNYLFGPQDVIVALGQDGLVANTLKYLDGQPVVGVNPDPSRWDGQLLPFNVGDLVKVLPEVFQQRRPTKRVTMAQAVLNNGLKIFGVNDLFIGPKTHGSARYRIELGPVAEDHSSSGIIVSTGLGSTGWLKSLLTGAVAITQSRFETDAQPSPENLVESAFDWDASYLCFTVREPFPSKTTSASLVFGQITPNQSLTLISHMAENGVIFSDGIEQDFLEFNSGTRAVISLAERQGRLVV